MKGRIKEVGEGRYKGAVSRLMGRRYVYNWGRGEAFTITLSIQHLCIYVVYTTHT